MARLNLFLAIDLPKPVKDHVAETIKKLSRNNFPVSWIEPKESHITLAFLGRTEKEEAKEAIKAAGLTASKTLPFPITVGSISYFYGERKTGDSVIFLSVLDQDRELKALYKMLRENLVSADFQPPERLQPHISLGRLKKQKKKHEQQELLSKIADCEISFLQFQVESIGLYESLGNREKRYRLLKRFELGKN